MSLTFPFTEAPENHQVVTIHPHVKWVRSPLPFSLAHINCYLLKDGDGWCVLDTGMNGKEAISRWEKIIAEGLDGAPITRVISTHHHPDHNGLAGWFCDTYKVPFYTTEAEYYYTRTFYAPKRSERYWESAEYFDRTGINEESKEALLADSNYSHMVTEVPGAFHRVVDGDRLKIGDYEWEAITTRGHSPEHLSLYCEALDMMLSGDQVLPAITSNVSISPTQAYANPLKDWFDAHDKVKARIPDSVLVLPAHELPFKGLHQRLQAVVDHHHERLDKIVTLCGTSINPQEITNELFDREMDEFQNFLAVGEVMAHLNWLLNEKRVSVCVENGVYQFSADF
ncbi:MAG: MBL fold metallo-hydrolase [Pseudomonadales bacterium]|nr:MBL fold metallo-hydrolase [Pseudomonadales bacterium]